MSHYVPPHRRKELDGADLSNVQSHAFQQEAWRALSRTITAIINRVNSENIADSATELFRENIVRGRGLLSRALMRTQQVDSDLTPVLCALVSRVNKEFPTVILVLCKRLVVNWTRAHRRRDWATLENMSLFLGWLYNFEVIDVIAIYQIINAHLSSETRGEEDVDQAAKVFRATFRAMSLRSRREFNEEVLTPFRDLLAMDDDDLRLSSRSQAVLEACLKEVQQWERVKDEVAIIPENLILFGLSEQTTHSLDIEERYNTEDALDRYVYDAEYEKHEDDYEVARKAVLGDDWEMELLEGVAAAEEEDEEAEEAEEGGDGNEHRAYGASRSGEASTTKHVGGTATASSSSGATSTDHSKALIDEAEREVRKEVYMAIRSSVRADEAAHKILRVMKPHTERTICFMVVEGCCEERTFKRLYGMLAERLCKSNARFQSFFVESFRTRYLDASELSAKQIEYTCGVFVHLLRTDSLYWSRCFSVLDIANNNESQRLFIQYLLQGLAEEMNIQKLADRFIRDKELRDSTGKLFPVTGTVETLEMAINMYVAMGLGALAQPLRAELDRRRGLGRDGRKRLRDGNADDDREYI